MFKYIRAIVSSALRRKSKNYKNEPQIVHPIYTCSKKNSLKWYMEDKCQCCGANPGRYKAICDDCLWT